MDLPEVGDVFEGRYHLGELLGEGGFARVYLAHDASMSRDIALKVLSPTGGKYREVTAARFMREVRMIAELQDPHTVTLYDFGQTDGGLLYMACEYIPGVDLKKVLDRAGRLPPKTVAHILSQVLQSLREAHQKGMTHRDIKPANILIYEYEADPYRAKLVDFGLAKPNTVDATQITRQGFSAGTPRYMSPEQVLAQPLGAPSDIYSLGLVAYEMLTGEPAVDADTRKELLKKQVTGPPIVLPADTVPPELSRIVERMVQRPLDVRYGSADEVLRDLDAHPRPLAVSEEAETTPQSSLPERLRSQAPERMKERTGDTATSSRTALWIGLITVALSVFMVVALVLPTRSSTKDEIAIPPSVRVVSEPPREPAAIPEREADMSRDVGSLDATTDVDPSDEQSGCGKTRKLGSSYSVPFWSDGFERSVRVRFPTNYDPAEKHAVLIMFRGRQLRPYVRPDDAEDFFGASGLKRALERGYILAGVEPLKPEDPWLTPIDAHFAQAMMGALDGFGCIDRDRLFAVGHDLGAAEAQRFACRQPLRGLGIWHDLLAVGEQRCSPEPPVPVMYIYGKRDEDVGNGRRGSNCDHRSPTYVGHNATAAEWEQRNGCQGPVKQPWKASAAQIDGVCKTTRCSAAAYTQCTLTDAGRQLPFPTNAAFWACHREVPRFDLAGNTLDFFAEQGRRERK